MYYPLNVKHQMDKFTCTFITPLHYTNWDLTKFLLLPNRMLYLLNYSGSLCLIEHVQISWYFFKVFKGKKQVGKEHASPEFT